MATAEVFEFESHPGRTLSLLLFTDVTNSRELNTLLRAGKLDPELALLNAALVPGTLPVLLAAQKALTLQSRKGLITKTLHSELVYSYSGSKHITESLKRCGINDEMTYILVARFDATQAELNAARQLIKGTQVNLLNLALKYSKELITKFYKVTPAELHVSTLEEAIICRIGARDAL
ncbi:hypothetical protein CBR_g38557 [Chara braunii]|uniref:EKC/KEOPS complex subunit cgi121 n=1 Tax=Chara braunii TaxID=69332 RepID=A0A388K0B2_CHABU|nr:hypothetical protein CBR_g38557 [Chara braunii]|eukprot:GBG63489.1 hypothetical protein CBR_g38557 [Chara braunii]